MKYFRLSCSELFVCTAILCWDSTFLQYSFINITDCTPSPLYLTTNLQFTLENKAFFRTQQKSWENGFICSNCTQNNRIKFSLNTTNQCYKHSTMIELRNYCQYSLKSRKKENTCQCFPSDQPIYPINDWTKALIKPSKSHMNAVRANNINKSASTSVYILVGSVLLLVLFGGILGILFYYIKVKSIQPQTMK